MGAFLLVASSPHYYHSKTFLGRMPSPLLPSSEIHAKNSNSPSSFVIETSEIHIRGGADENSPMSTDGQAPPSTPTTTSGFVGVLDLRPDASTSASAYEDPTSTKALIVSGRTIAALPRSMSSHSVNVAMSDEEEGINEADENEAVAAETVGASCNTICLLIAYNPVGGTTVLHRTAGVQIVSLINGIRQQLRKQKDKVKLRLILFRDTRQEEDGEEIASSSSTSNEGSSWNREGIDFLIERMRMFYAMSNDSSEDAVGGGSNDEDSNDPFESVEIEPLWISSSSGEAVAGDDITLEAILSKMNSDSHAGDAKSGIWSDIQELYNSMGGNGSINSYQI